MTETNARTYQGATAMTKSATITKAPEWDVFAKVERVQWRIETSTGRTKYVRTRREAREWCEEFGYSVTPGGSKGHD